MANFQIDKLKWIPYVLGVILVVLLILSAYNYFTIKDGEWACIAQRCTEFAKGDEWVNSNCQITSGEPLCKFTYNNQEYELPLSEINVEQMTSCKQYECAVEVYVKKYGN
jgi:hypothetical protein